MASPRHLALALALALALPATGCATSAEDICDDLCECQYCTDFEWNNCIDYYESWEREAEYWDCEDYYGDWMDCQDEFSGCNRGGWSTSCGNEKSRLDSCVHRYPIYD